MIPKFIIEKKIIQTVRMILFQSQPNVIYLHLDYQSIELLAILAPFSPTPEKASSNSLRYLKYFRSLSSRIPNIQCLCLSDKNIFSYLPSNLSTYYLKILFIAFIIPFLSISKHQLLLIYYTASFFCIARCHKKESSQANFIYATFVNFSNQQQLKIIASQKKKRKSQNSFPF